RYRIRETGKIGFSFLGSYPGDPPCYRGKSRMFAKIFSGLVRKSFVGGEIIGYGNSTTFFHPCRRPFFVALSPIRVISVIRGSKLRLRLRRSGSSVVDPRLRRRVAAHSLSDIQLQSSKIRISK